MDVHGKRVLVVGLGKSGVACALFLAERGAKVAVSDAKSEEQLRQEIPLCSITACQIRRRYSPRKHGIHGGFERKNSVISVFPW
jgi:UDP-N-acetylmuramoylalanine-D-glutamate ligase